MNPRRILPMHESDVAALTSCVGEFLRDFGYSTESRVLSHSPLVRSSSWHQTETSLVLCCYQNAASLRRMNRQGSDSLVLAPATICAPLLQ